MEPLERRYRRLLSAFPRGYRQQRGEEMLATLLETAEPGQERPSRRDSVEILQAALRERLGMHCAPGLQDGIRIAGPFALVLAAGCAVYTWALTPSALGPAVVAATWTVATLALVFARRLLAASVALAWLASVGIAAGLAFQDSTHTFPIIINGQLIFSASTSFTYAFSLASGLIALLAVLTVPWRPSIVERIGVALAVAGAAAAAIFGPRLDPSVPQGFTMRPTWVGIISLLPALMIVVGVVLRALRRSTTALAWCGFLLLVPMPLLTWSDSSTVAQYVTGLSPFSINGFFQYGLMPLGPWNLVFLGGFYGVYGASLLAGCVVVAVILADANRRAGRPHDGRAALSALSALALGTVAGICTLFLADEGYHGGLSLVSGIGAAAPLAAAVAVPWLPMRLRRPAIGLGLATLVACPLVAPHSFQVEQYALLILVGLLVVSLGDVRMSGRLIASAAIGAAVSTLWLNWLTIGQLWPTSSLYWQGTAMASVASIVLLFTLWWAPMAVVLAPRGWIGAMLAFVAGLAWLGLQLSFVQDLGMLLASGTSVLILVIVARFTYQRIGRGRPGRAGLASTDAVPPTS